MLNDSGNLIKENIQITKELLDFCLEAGYFIDLKSGDYSKECSPMKRNDPYNRDLVLPIWEMYTEGVMFPGKYYKIFKFRMTQFLTQAFKYCGFKTLTRTELLALYKDDINNLAKETWIENWGVDNPSKHKELHAKSVAKAKETLKTGIPKLNEKLLLLIIIQIHGKLIYLYRNQNMEMIAAKDWLLMKTRYAWILTTKSLRVKSESFSTRTMQQHKLA